MITPYQFQEMALRVTPKVKHTVPEDATNNESELHSAIMEWIKKQHPLPAYTHARMDRKSRMTLGAPDFILLFRGRVLLIECKTKTGKRSSDQLAWALLAELNGFSVHEVRSFSQFLEVINQTK